MLISKLMLDCIAFLKEIASGNSSALMCNNLRLLCKTLQEQESDLQATNIFSLTVFVSFLPET